MKGINIICFWLAGYYFKPAEVQSEDEKPNEKAIEDSKCTAL